MGFIETYFLNPIAVEQGYNYVNTITYAVIALVLLYVLFLVFRKLKVKIDFKFLLSALPFVLFASSLRAFVDSGIVERSFWTVSPGIYLLAAGLFLTTLFFTFLLIKPNWQKATALIGTAFLAYLWLSRISLIQFENVSVFLMICTAVVLGLVVSYFIFKTLKWKWISDKFGFSAFSAHLFDAVVTAMILFFVGGFEKHPLPRFFIEQFGSFSFIPLKLAVIIPAVFIVSKEVKDQQMRNYLLIAIAILGLGEGLRNLISLVLV